MHVFIEINASKILENLHRETYQSVSTCSKSTMETPEKCVKIVQS